MNDTEILKCPRILTAIQAESERLGFTMASEPRTGVLLRALVHSKPAAAVLELGTGTGVATAWLLDGMDTHARLITIENDSSLVSVAQTHLGKDPRISFYVEDAATALTKIADKRFDLIFADTWVGKYTHLAEALRLLKDGGLYVIDDMLPQANWPVGHAEKVSQLIHILETRSDLILTKLNWSSGIILAVKKNARTGTELN